MVLVKGIEPPTYALRVRCSTPELHQRMCALDTFYDTHFLGIGATSNLTYYRELVRVMLLLMGTHRPRCFVRFQSAP